MDDNNDPPTPLSGILETVLYCTDETEPATRDFYEDILRLDKVSQFAYRFGSQVMLLFNSDQTKSQEWPPAHGTYGRGHICFTVEPDAYDSWKRYVAGNNVDVIEEIDWSRGIRSFYFYDPAGNVLEIANGDMWPKEAAIASL